MPQHRSSLSPPTPPVPPLTSTSKQVCATTHAGHHFLEFAHLFHHLSHLSKSVEHRVQLRDRDSTALCDALTPLRIQDIWVFAFLRCHPADHRFHMHQFLFLLAEIGSFDGLGPAWQHANNRFQRTEFLHLPQLVLEIFERKLALAHFFF